MKSLAISLTLSVVCGAAIVSHPCGASSNAPHKSSSSAPSAGYPQTTTGATAPGSDKNVAGGSGSNAFSSAGGGTAAGTNAGVGPNPLGLSAGASPGAAFTGPGASPNPINATVGPAANASMSPNGAYPPPANPMASAMPQAPAALPQGGNSGNQPFAAGRCEPGGDHSALSRPETPAQGMQPVRRGGDIPCRSWRVADRPALATLLCLHGFGMDMNSYNHFGKQMADLGMAVYAIDIRGFGCWQEAEGYNKLDFPGAIEDVHEALKAIRKAHPDVPLILVGESMGGSVALQAMASAPALADGLICSVPAGDRFGEKATDVKVALGMLSGHRKVSIGKSIVKQITKDPSLRSKLRNDPRGRMTFSPKELMQFSKFMNRTDEEAKKITDAPVLILQGGSDRLVKPKGTASVYIKLGTKDKDMMLIGSSEHLIIEEGQSTEHVADIVSSWIYRHVVMQRFPNGRFTAESTGLSKDVFREANGHFRVGQGLVDLGDHKAAREHLLQAITIGRGSPIAMISAQILATLSKPVIAVNIGNSRVAGRFVSHDEAMANDKPSVIFFGARWIDPSYDLNEVLERGAARFGNRINFVRIDADDPKNQRLVEGYGVYVVPTILFLNPTNQIVGSEIGSLNDQTLLAALPKILFNNVANAPISIPANDAPGVRPTVVFFGSSKSIVSSQTEGMLEHACQPYAGRLDLIKIDAADPRNAPLLKQYGANQLPVVLFLNSSHDVVSYTTGSTNEEQIKQGLANVIFIKRLPLESVSSAAGGLNP